jgi:hypothetical protein
MKDLVIDQDKEDWIKNKIQAIRNELKRMKPDGAVFDSTLLSIITKEKHYVSSGHREGIGHAYFGTKYRPNGRMTGVLKVFSRFLRWTVQRARMRRRSGRGDWHRHQG